MSTKNLTPSQQERLARTYRLMAGRMYAHLARGTAERAQAKGAIAKAHDACCEAFSAIEAAPERGEKS